MRLPGTSSRRTAVLDVLSLALLVLAMVIFHDTYTTRSRSTPPGPPAASIRPGDVLAPLPVSDSTGTPLTLLDGDGPAWTVLLAFRSDCPACAAQKADWMVLAREARSSGWQVAALTPEPLEGGVRRYFGGSLVRLARIDGASPAARALGVSVVPATILVGPGRKILFAGNGRLAPATLDSVRTLLATGGGSAPGP